jgi:hypothetical protein
MEAEAFSVLRASVSQDRLEPYLAACRGDQAAAARLYARNIQISAALHAPLGCLEVACRNAMHHQLSALLGREDWWDATELRLHHTAQRIANDAKRDIVRRRGPITAARMVAELPFGFWVSLLGSGTDYENRLWSSRLAWGVLAIVGQPWRWRQTAKSGRNLEAGTLPRALTGPNILSDGNF